MEKHKKLTLEDIYYRRYLDRIDRTGTWKVDEGKAKVCWIKFGSYIASHLVMGGHTDISTQSKEIYYWRLTLWGFM